ncbi:hypothetical protein P7C73_g1572, partial [Tremellales sp. Uapishka_1]
MELTMPRRRYQDEKVSLLSVFQEDSDSDISTAPRRLRSSKSSSALWKRTIVLLAAAGYLGYLYTPCSPSLDLAFGLEQCDYISTIPGPSASFSKRKVSDRFEPGTKPILLKNATIWTGNGNGTEVIEGDLLMDNGLVKAIGEVDLAGLRDIQVVDVEGAWVTPGLVDGHSHAGLEGANSVQGNIHPYVRSLDVFDTHAIDTHLIIAGGVTSQLLLPGSAVGIGGQAYVAKFRPTTSNSASSWLVEPPFDLDPKGNMTGKRIPSHWRHMKHALGENPDRVFNIVRMDNIWDIRKAYKAASDWKDKQSKWCSKARSASRWSREDIGEFPAAPLEHEALVDVLNGKVKLNVHSYEVTDFDALVRVSNEFGIEVAGIHHAHEAWLVPDLLKKMYKHPPCVAIFAAFSMYKQESYRSSWYAPKILSDAGLEVVMKSDHSGVVARYLMQEAALAHHWGLNQSLAMAAVTTTPAKMIGLDHRIGFLRPGYDADVVVWQGHPLSLGATPAQVYIDGLPQIKSPVLRGRPNYYNHSPRQGNFSNEIAHDIATKGEPDYSPKAVLSSIAFTNVSVIVLRRDGALRDLTPSGAKTFDVVMENGEITCLGVCEYQSSLTKVLDLRGGTIFPGLIASGAELGVVEFIENPDVSDNTPSPDPVGHRLPSLTEFALSRAADGVSFDTKNFWRIIQSGVTHSVTAPHSGGLLAGASTFIRLGAKHSLDDGILVDDLALHVGITHGEGDVSVSTQIGALRSLLQGASPKGSELGLAFASVVRGEKPLVVSVRNADAMARLLTLKNEVESSSGKTMRWVFEGASEAHLVAKEIASAGVGVIVAPARAFPYASEESRALPGVPLSGDTVVSALYNAGVTVGLEQRSDTPPFQSALFTSRFQLGNIVADTITDIPFLDVIAMATTNLENLLGVHNDDRISKMLEKDFVAYQDGPIASFGGSKVVAFGTKGGVGIF